MCRHRSLRPNEDPRLLGGPDERVSGMVRRRVPIKDCNAGDTSMQVSLSSFRRPSVQQDFSGVARGDHDAVVPGLAEFQFDTLIPSFRIHARIISQRTVGRGESSMDQSDALDMDATRLQRWVLEVQVRGHEAHPPRREAGIASIPTFPSPECGFAPAFFVVDTIPQGKPRIEVDERYGRPCIAPPAGLFSYTMPRLASRRGWPAPWVDPVGLGKVSTSCSRSLS